MVRKMDSAEVMWWKKLKISVDVEWNPFSCGHPNSLQLSSWCLLADWTHVMVSELQKVSFWVFVSWQISTLVADLRGYENAIFEIWLPRLWQVTSVLCTGNAVFSFSCVGMLKSARCLLNVFFVWHTAVLNTNTGILTSKFLIQVLETKCLYHHPLKEFSVTN